MKYIIKEKDAKVIYRDVQNYQCREVQEVISRNSG